MTPQLETTLSELQKTLALMATSLKGIDDKVAKLGSTGGIKHDQQGRGGDRRDNRDNRRPPPPPAVTTQGELVNPHLPQGLPSTPQHEVNMLSQGRGRR